MIQIKEIIYIYIYLSKKSEFHDQLLFIQWCGDNLCLIRFVRVRPRPATSRSFLGKSARGRPIPGIAEISEISQDVMRLASAPPPLARLLEGRLEDTKFPDIKVPELSYPPLPMPSFCSSISILRGRNDIPQNDKICIADSSRIIQSLAMASEVLMDSNLAQCFCMSEL